MRFGKVPLNKYVKRLLWRAFPRSPVTNRLFALSFFQRHHHRFPRNPRSPKATFEDYVFRRMGGPWTPFHEMCVDKEFAKRMACTMSPTLKTARTAAVMAVEPRTTLEDVGRFLYPFLGKPFVAKPTHTSGGIVFLERPPAEVAKQTLQLFGFARQNYFFSQFEAQYERLARKVLVEESLGREVPHDYRFYSARGKVFFCQFDQGRFGDHRQALFTVPDHRHIPIPDQFPLPNPLPESPPHWEEMLQIASDLSKPFDFVRVDLYDIPEGVYFSEFTFTPNASVLPFMDPVFSRKLLEDVLQAQAEGASA
jgi:hypothetical protein